MENPDERVEGQVQEGDGADPMAELGNQNRPTDPPRERQDDTIPKFIGSVNT